MNSCQENGPWFYGSDNNWIAFISQYWNINLLRKEMGRRAIKLTFGPD